MSEKGVLSKSIANNISEAIIDKLGGTGYTPIEWSKNINLLGISSADIEEALASITEDTSSSDKGSLSLSIASDMGAILNKKYNTSRGFKPSEVSSAVSALTPLPEKTTSSAPIVTFSDGADDVPLKSCEVALSPSLDGYSSVTVHHTDGQTPPVFSEDYTASLGRTIYGGSADIVNGEGKETHGKKVFDGTEGTGGTPAWTMISVSQGTMFRIAVSDKVTTSATNTLCSYYTPVAQAQRADGTVSGAGTNVDIIDNRFSSVDDFKAWLAENPVTLVYELATPTDFTFDGQEINTRLGYNAFWSDEGDTEVTYRADLDLYEAPSMLLGANNTETEGNEEQEVNE